MTVGVPEGLWEQRVLKVISSEEKKLTREGSKFLVQKYFNLDMSIVFSYKYLTSNETAKRTYNTKSRRASATIVGVEKRYVLHVLSVCL